MKNQTIDPADLPLRHHLGIPDDAERVLIFSESSHWDPNWLFTSEAYYDRFVNSNLDQAIEALQREPRRVYSIECIFFLKMYWDRRPDRRDAIRALMNEGRLRMTSSGVTTADTLLPSTEALLRDWLIGQEWLRANGMTQEPKLAYFTDSFGCTPALPSLLNAAGFDRAAITRVDGMHFVGCDLESAKRFPRPGSTAELLSKQARTVDFVWRDRNGAQVLCHWNAFNYGQGDMLAHVGISRIYIVNVAWSLRTDRHIARRIGQFVDQLAPLSRTPYMYCPIGFDFVEPIPDLVALLDRYNENHYPDTGIWAVNAGLDDYLSLVEDYQDQLPVLELDPNPYWTGFYTARPVLKQQCRTLVDDLLLAEKLALLPENQSASETISDSLEDAWWNAVVSNHHDFITGTSPDEVVEEEQIPWLEQAAKTVSEVTQKLIPDTAMPVSTLQKVILPKWSRSNGRIQIKTPYYVVELDETAGGAIVGYRNPETDSSWLTGISNDLISYEDSGGLWRMGCEFRGGKWKEAAKASDQPVQVQIHEGDDGLEVTCSFTLQGEAFTRRMRFSNEAPAIRCRVEGKAAEGHAVITRFATNLAAQTLTMDTPGGIVTRPPQRFYNPTFWPFQHFVHIQDDGDGHGVAILQTMPGAVSYQPDGTLELVAMRNATQETAFGFIHLPANPASGHEREAYSFDYALLFTASGDWRDNDVAIAAQNFIDNSPWDDPIRTELQRRADKSITTDCPNVRVIAVKPASRGEGIIARLYSPSLPASPVTVTVNDFAVAKAILCDARERDLEPLPVRDNAIQVTLRGTIATLRLLQG